MSIHLKLTVSMDWYVQLYSRYPAALLEFNKDR